MILDASSAYVHEQLARGYAAVGDKAETLSELHAAVRLRPDDAQIHSALSQVLAGQGDIAEAIEEERKALKLADNDADRWERSRGHAAAKQQTNRGKAALEHALRLQPDHQRARAV